MPNRPILCLVLLVAGVVRADAGGEMRCGGVAWTPAFAAAFPGYDFLDARKKVTLVVLAEAPFDVDRVRNGVGVEAALRNDVGLGDKSRAWLWVRADGSVSMSAWLPAVGQLMADSPRELAAALGTNDRQRVAGRVSTRAPVAVGAATCTADFSFDVPVSRGDGAQALPAKGSEPARALEALYAAIAAKNLAAIEALVAPETRAGLHDDARSPEENLAYALERLGASLPGDARVVGGELRGPSRALLEVEGSIGQMRALSIVEMAKGEAGWQWDGVSLMIGGID